ncbi:ExeM/NucH family extracellular endonuclease [uncultured Rhodospira sp.]|uniref:ExeM/NucH family extracellular endonuclease n=1 Tax=uncultured Rhodospira sp. TaxID=1936189 RepID=UPI002633B967|nr:ExeM/NucH family extracellular endonuclease [uncultured Rhodospira sp.]
MADKELLAWWSFNNTDNDADLLNSTEDDKNARSNYGHMYDNNDPYDDGFYEPARGSLFPVSDAYSGSPGALIFATDPGVGIPNTADYGAWIDVSGLVGDNFETGTADNWGSYSGTADNRPSGTYAGGSLSVVGDDNNGSAFAIRADLSGWEDIEVSWAQRGTSTGFSARTVEVSTDGVTFTEVYSDSGALSSSWTIETADIGALLDDAENAIIRFTVDGASSNSGNNRFDNIQLLGAPLTTTVSAVINEFMPNPPGGDPSTQTFELLGTAGAAFEGWVVSIESDAGSSAGLVDRASQVSGTFDANGLLTVDVPDLENPSFTVALVSDFTGATDSTDIDTDDDGVADDLSAFGTVYDAIGVPDDAGELLYGTDLGGTDMAFFDDEPRLIFRDGATGELYAVDGAAGSGSVFDASGAEVNATGFDVDPTAGTDTFGAVNPTYDGSVEPVYADQFISAIQGSTDLADGTLVGVSGAADESPMLGEAVRIQGVVTAVFADLGGFYVQEEDTDVDGDAFSSEGIFVASSGVMPDLGNLVTVEGSVAEVEGETRLTVDTVAVDDDSDLRSLITAATIAFPTATVLMDADGDYVANLEAYEGMMVTVPEAMSVTELFQLDRFGTIRISSEGRLEQFTQSNAPSVAGYTQHLKDVAARSLVIDDGSDVQNPGTLLVPGLGADGTLDGGDVFRMGDAYTNLTGVLSFSEDSQSSSEEPEYRLHRPDATLTQTNPRPEAPEDVHAEGEGDTDGGHGHGPWWWPWGNHDEPEDIGSDFKVASFNVLNFFTTLDTWPDKEGVGPNGLDPRGADTNPAFPFGTVGPTDEYDRQLAKLVEAIVAVDADVVGLLEIENDFMAGGVSPDPAPQYSMGPVAIQALVDEINAFILADTGVAGTYDWVRPDGEFVGDDAIAVGMIYDSATTKLADGTTVETLQDSDLAALGVDPGHELFNGAGTNRVPLAASFTEIATNGTFTVAVNHFKSKGSVSPFGDNADKGDGAGNNNEARLQAAQAVDAWLDTDPTGSGDDDVLIIGDLNAYRMEDPITFLQGEGYTDLASAYEDDPYSYVFDGQTGTLDYMLSNTTLTGQVTGATEWHINADEPDAFDYNLDYNRDPSLYTDGPYRASDHDPIIIGLDLAPERILVSGGPRLDFLRGSDADELFVGGGGRDFIWTSGGSDVVDIGGLLDNGRKDVTFIFDFDVDEDILGGVAASDVARSRSSFWHTKLVFESGDKVFLTGVRDADDIDFEYDDTLIA